MTDELAAGDHLVGSDRVLAILIELAQRPDGAGLEELGRAVASPKSTVHRALASLTRAGLARKEGVGHYVLGDEFLRLAFAHHEARPEHVRVLPALRALATRFGETAHYAVLDGAEVVYRAKVDPPTGAVRLTSTIGGRNPAYCTGVGKLLLSNVLPDDTAVRRWLDLHALSPRTEHTITEPDAFVAELARIRERGYAVDDQENEVGVNCVAVPAARGPGPYPAGAISVSALAYRTPLADLLRDVRIVTGLVQGSTA
ncbi:IclR family transcriptional regulator [Pengzhenrongella sp.]|jgi:DNA-binding IclR family transcriptional regulator|uniref:IclR family transcriptional regulator n=1 Tax=Pengzhenrongella sp. TaxID=2888820 RepID=UPI002F93DB36